ncbi:trihelix transcription factor ENAP2-like isoform X2 [Solanum dulcamara]|uniref:trihelix transcription factor ENAP2-like isoform X2 n=1 Tax=Solanum dulcamara TaxID=45834 RepID=UPI0024852BD0|nr:trihelix transcription factor ENAP2-like isoform X2 [Solanum dulcamara]
MYRRPNHTDYFSPSSLSSSSNPNSSTTVQQSNCAAVSSPTSPMSDDDLVASPSSNNNSPSPSPSPPQSSLKNELVTLPPPTTIPPASTRSAAFPAREDCWSEAATHTLIEAWGSHYMELKRGNLRQKHWQEVANAVNALHGHTKKQFRTDIQCKNRIDTLKKKYKIEKARVSQSQGRYVPQWPFFNSLDVLIGDNFKPSPSPLPLTVAPRRKTPPLLPPPPSAVPVGPRSKRPAAVMEDAVSRRNFSAMAAAAAAAASEDSEEEEESETSSPVTFNAGALSRRKESGALVEGCSRLAEAIGRFAEIYERVEDAKQRQMVELEKQRMQFAKDLEIQRMKLIMESQVQLEKLKRAKNSSQADGYL